MRAPTVTMLLALAGAIAAPAGRAEAATLDPSQSSLVFELQGLVTFLDPEARGTASFDGASLQVPADTWSLQGSTTTGFFTLGITAGNDLGLFRTGFLTSNRVGTLPLGGDGVLAGVGGLTGQLVLDVLGSSATLPLGVVGAGGITRATIAGQPLTLSGAAWATGPVNVTLGTIASTRTGGRVATPAGGVSITLVTPMRLRARNGLGDTTGFVTQTLVFVPEPGGIVLLATGAVGLVAAAACRRGG